MGTSVPLKSREKECIGADPQIYKRKLTEEEIARYNSPQRNGRSIDEQLKGRSNEMKKQKPEKPSKEQLLEMLKQYPNKYRATYAIGDAYGVHRTTIDNWIKAYGIPDIWSKPEETLQAVEQENDSGVSEIGIQEFDEAPKEDADEMSNAELISVAIRGAEPIKLEPNTDMEVQKLGIDESTQEQTEEEFILTNKVFRFGPFGVDLQYDMKQVVICDPDNDGELVIPFKKLARIAGNLQKISTELTEREVM
ncbi:MAG TPA: hypothetical protein VN549_03700 [Negativicutes bacterium]|nr:hypothetical protein [Negativicutes bacterium]